MLEEPYQPILDRKTPIEDVKKHFHEQIKLLQEIANYGSNLIPRCFRSSKRKPPDDIVILSVLLKQIVAMIDAVEVLVSHGAVFATHLPARSLFETWLYIEWILKKDTSKRAKQYYVWDLRKRQYWDRRAIKGYKEQEEFSKAINKFDSMLEEWESQENKAKEELEQIENLLDRNAYKEINQEFDRLKGGRKYDVAWYRPWGPKSLGHMASKLGLKAEYLILYDEFSRIMHATDFQRHVVIGEGLINFEPVRKLDEFGFLVSIVINLSIRVYRTILHHYRSAEIQNFNNKYANEWRNRFLSIKKVKYKIIPRPLDF